MKSYMLIANPAAGGGTAARAIPRIEALMDQNRLSYDMVRTNQPGHGIELSRKAAGSGYDVVIAAGGDGTVNEVINGLMIAKQSGQPVPALGVLGAGRGNDFAHAVGIPADLQAACVVLAQDERRVVDVGRVSGGFHPEGRYFGNCVGVGFDAITTIEAHKLPRLGGFLSYLIAVFKTIFLYYRAPVTTVRFGDQTLTQPSLMISVMNGRRLGGGFLMAPDSHPDDGLFDLCIAGQVSRARIFTLIPHFLRGTQATQTPITTGQAVRISISSVNGSLPAQTDGEIISVDGRSLEIELLPRRLEVVCPASGLVL